MNMPNVDQDVLVADVPVSPMLGASRSRYGSVRGLDDEELADPDELEQQVYRETFEPVMQLPSKAKHRHIQAAYDEQGRVDWGAFATVDFERMQPQLDKALYKADKLREELKDLVIRMQSLNERVTLKHKYKVLKMVKMGYLDAEQIQDFDLFLLARLYKRVLRLRQQIADLHQASFRRKKRQAEQFWARLEG